MPHLPRRCFPLYYFPIVNLIVAKNVLWEGDVPRCSVSIPADSGSAEGTGGLGAVALIQLET